MTLSILIPARNEELSISDCVLSCLAQTRKADQILFVNDGSTDRTGEILASFGDKIQVHTIPVATGNKSRAQEIGLRFITSDIVVMSDADSILDLQFLERVEKGFSDPDVVAVAGHVRSLKYNWVTACRAIEYSVAQYVHKVAQNYMGYIFVLPGAAAGFKTEILRKIPFAHATVCEDLDLTYILHEQHKKLFYDTKAVVYTADPSTLRSYLGQIRRWHTGGAECFRDHWRILFTNPVASIELSLSYISTAVSAVLLFFLPFISLQFFGLFIVIPMLVFALACSAFAAIAERRPALILYSLPFLLIILLNNYVIVETAIQVFFGKRKQLAWFSPGRYMPEEKKIALTLRTSLTAETAAQVQELMATPRLDLNSTSVVSVDKV